SMVMGGKPYRGSLPCTACPDVPLPCKPRGDGIGAGHWPVVLLCPAVVLRRRPSRSDYGLLVGRSRQLGGGAHLRSYPVRAREPQRAARHHLGSDVDAVLVRPTTPTVFIEHDDLVVHEFAEVAG